MVNQLVMSLVCYVDEQLAREQKSPSSDFLYCLEEPQPEIWIEPELYDFFVLIRPFLAQGSKLDMISAHLKRDPSEVHKKSNQPALAGVDPVYGWHGYGSFGKWQFAGTGFSQEQ